MAPKSSFLDKVLGRIGRLDPEGLQTVVKRLARERNFLETLFNTIEDGVLVLDETGRILYYNQAILTLLAGQKQLLEGQPIDRLLPELGWARLARSDGRGGGSAARHPPPKIWSRGATVGPRRRSSPKAGEIPVGRERRNRAARLYHQTVS